MFSFHTFRSDLGPLFSQSWLQYKNQIHASLEAEYSGIFGAQHLTIQAL